MPHERRVSRAPALHARGGSQELPDPGDGKAPAIHPWRQSLYCSSKARRLTTGARRIFGRWILLACFACLPVHAQDTQFLPEIDAHLTFNSCVRGYLQAKDDREGGDPTQFTFGPSIEFYLKPLIKLKSVTQFDLDDAKSRPLVLESGYRLITLRILQTKIAYRRRLPFAFRFLPGFCFRIGTGWISIGRMAVSRGVTETN